MDSDLDSCLISNWNVECIFFVGFFLFSSAENDFPLFNYRPITIAL